ncbi:sensor histidine kinase [Sutcliffiella halmapala]|uniref:sensor histidine kinase n=1 Tax=Sutcliffiella halmapala TaxID=79882 RepID=UPI0009949C2E|nr:sensor histidine kinase [Sutcliffiella halmapala]
MKAFQMLKRLSGKMFYRVFFTYSTIIFLTMSILFVFLSEYYSNFIVQRELDRQETVVKEMQSEIKKKHQFVNHGVQQLYLDKRLIEDLAFALQHDYQEYIGYRLDKFSKSESFVPYNFDLFVKNYFSRDSEVVALQIQNNTIGTEYVFLFNRSRWYNSNNHLSSSETENLETDEFEEKDLYIVEERINDPVSLERLGNVSVYFTYDNLKQLLSLRESEVNGSFLIMDENLNVYFSHGDIENDVLKELNYSSVQKELKLKEHYYVQSSIEPSSKLMVIAIIPKGELAPLLKYKLTIFLIILFLTTVAIALPYFSLRGYSKRVDEILETMKEVQEGNLEARIETSKIGDDLTIISTTFNETLEELNDYIHKVYLSKLKQKEAELANLQAQINPHFLYNTLEAIRMKSLAEGGRTSAKMIVQLAQLFRYSLKTGELVTVQNEWNHAEQYIELYKIRFQNYLKTELVMADKLQHYYVPPFILQPLIENFLIHGFKRDSEDNELTVLVYEKQEKLWIEIKDNGKGIERPQLEEIKQRLRKMEGSSDSIGLGNVHQRIRMKYGEPYGVEIESTPEINTTVTVILPLLSEVLLDDSSNVSR